MHEKILSVDVSERLRLAALKVDQAKAALAMAEAELRVWESMDKEVAVRKPQRQTFSQVTPVHTWGKSDGAKVAPVVTRAKRERRPNEIWMKVLAKLESQPMTQDELLRAVAPLNVDRRMLIGQVRRYTGDLGLLSSADGLLRLTDRARGFLAGFQQE